MRQPLPADRVREVGVQSKVKVRACIVGSGVLQCYGVDGTTLHRGTVDGDLSTIALGRAACLCFPSFRDDGGGARSGCLVRAGRSTIRALCVETNRRLSSFEAVLSALEWNDSGARRRQKCKVASVVNARSGKPGLRAAMSDLDE
jgi:hypothetical protein